MDLLPDGEFWREASTRVGISISWFSQKFSPLRVSPIIDLLCYPFERIPPNKPRVREEVADILDSITSIIVIMLHYSFVVDSGMFLP